eukprot:scaffold35182_cov56-Phaeocystis_antarctica.AAC.5
MSGLVSYSRHGEGRVEPRELVHEHCGGEPHVLVYQRGDRHAMLLPHSSVLCCTPVFLSRKPRRRSTIFLMQKATSGIQWYPTFLLQPSGGVVAEGAEGAAVSWPELLGERRREPANGGLKHREMARERSKILREECLGRVGGDVPQRRQAHISEAPREHGDTVSLDELRRGNGRLHRRLVSRCVDRLLAIREEQHDLSRARAATFGEELPRDFEAVGDRGVPVRRHLVDSLVYHGRVVRPWHTRRRIRREGHHREARRVLSEEVLVHLGRLGVGLGIEIWRFGLGIKLSRA